MDACLTVQNTIAWSIVDAADSYSQLAGVLGAVVFAGIVFLLGSPTEEDRRHGVGRALSVLPVVFVAMLLCSLLYAVLDGEQKCGRAAVEAVYAGISLATAAMALLLAMAWLLDAYTDDVTVRRNSNFAFYSVLAIAIFYLAVAVDDAATIVHNGELSQLSNAGLYSLLAAPSIIAVVYRASKQFVHRASPRLLNRVHQSAVIGILAFAPGLAVMFAVVSNQSKIISISRLAWVEWVAVAIAGIIFGLLVLDLPKGRSLDAKHQNHDPRSGTSLSETAAAD